MGAGLQHNMGHLWGPKAFSEMTKSAINPIYHDASQKLATKISKDRKRKATMKAKEQRRRSKYSKKDDSVNAQKAYSRHTGEIEPDEVTEDVSPETLEGLKQSFYENKVKVTKEEAKDIAQDTVNQGQSDLWRKERKKRLTASMVGSIAKMRDTTKKSNKVKQLLYTTFNGNKATRYGIEMEEVTRNDYVSHQHTNGHPGLKTESVGLVVSTEKPWIAASPDDRVYDPTAVPPFGLAEYKNPYSQKTKTLKEACQSKTFFLQMENKNGKTIFSLKRRHDYYYQIQCQLFCDSKEWCDFVVRTQKELHIE